MLRDSCVALIQQQLGFRTDQASNIVGWMQLAQQDLEGGITKPWFLTTGLNPASGVPGILLTTTPNIQTVAVPTDFLEEVDNIPTFYLPQYPVTPQPVIPLVKDDYQVLVKNFSDVQDLPDPSLDSEVVLQSTVQLVLNTGPPQAYALVGGFLWIFPVPDQVYTISFPYVQAGQILTSNIENVWTKNASKWIMGVAGKMAAQALRDQMAMQVFQTWEAEGSRLVEGQNTIRDMAGKDLQVGGPH